MKKPTKRHNHNGGWSVCQGNLTASDFCVPNNKQKDPPMTRFFSAGLALAGALLAMAPASARGYSSSNAVSPALHANIKLVQYYQPTSPATEQDMDYWRMHHHHHHHPHNCSVPTPTYSACVIQEERANASAP
jgi:hypothetical protein